MATLPITRAWTIPASGKATLSEIIDDDRVKWVTYVTARAGLSNAGNITWSDTDGGQTGGYMIPGEAVLLGDEMGGNTTNWFVFYGTSGDVVYFTIGISLGNTILG